MHKLILKQVLVDCPTSGFLMEEITGFGFIHSILKVRCRHNSVFELLRMRIRFAKFAESFYLDFFGWVILIFFLAGVEISGTSDLDDWNFHYHWAGSFRMREQMLPH